MLLARFAAESEADRRTADGRVTVAQRRQPEGAVEARVLVVADPDERQLEEPDDGREDLLARHLRSRQVLVDSLADGRQCLGEGEEPLVLRRLAPAAVAGVVAVLLPAAVITTGRLKVAVRNGADPDVGPGRRDRELPDPRERLGVADRAAAAAAIGEASTRAPSADAGVPVG